jgi:outer membrane protein assembly factor BamD (BamD/ComL family)
VTSAIGHILMIFQCFLFKKRLGKARRFPEFIEEAAMRSVTPIMVLISILLFTGGCAKIKWDAANEGRSVDSYEQFLAQYPNSEYAGEAKRRIEELSFEEAKQVNTIEAFEAFINRFPNSKFAHEAQAQIEVLFFQKAKRENSILAYEEFIRRFPLSPLKDEAQSNLESIYVIHFQTAKDNNTIDAYETFILRFPNSKFCKDAALLSEPLYYERALSENTVESYAEFISKYPNGKFIPEIKKRIKPLLISRQTAIFSVSFDKLLENYLIDLSPEKVITGIKALLNDYEFVDISLRNLSISYLIPFQELAQLQKENISQESMLDRLTGKARRRRDNISKINLRFQELKGEAAQVGYYLQTEYNIKFYTGDRDIEAILKR